MAWGDSITNGTRRCRNKLISIRITFKSPVGAYSANFIFFFAQTVSDICIDIQLIYQPKLHNHHAWTGNQEEWSKEEADDQCFRQSNTFKSL